jgi:hypothetical protein
MVNIPILSKGAKHFRLMALRMLIILCLFLTFSACSQSTDVNKAKPEEKAKVVDAPTPVKPKMGEVSVTLPKGWISVPQSQQKDAEVLSFIRRADQKLWANPGPIGTGNLPEMSLTVTLRDAKASRSDLDPQKLGNGLVKQKVFTQLVKAEEIKVANLTATIVVGDSPERGRTSIVMLPHNGFLYKWTLDGTREADMDVAADFDSFLNSAQIGKTN